MLPREIYLQQINRFHDKMKELHKKIEKLKGDDEFKEENYKLAKQYFQLCTMWEELDELCEMKIKHFIDEMESTNK